ncbi:MAG TPA: heparan-alpha-glucosaminide N-acetyltransferase domain-containing protein [Dinghuibacter sp.]|uniref:DUF1624 domain-containing protein n=1 Tax=Dinghuibacter sp. TaxID=2024697 RepID=UPI002CC14EA1|nr:heparan-alpha-glucosaminide N-acetyltransferase domain-containing protein [Dinghuibacter sp.]HTJ11041.1 heparan-alpha-glucosaminide N-acetyltransferase domain-containing protein [Dinghuibacter sp.]
MPAARVKYRVVSIDILRGAVMIIMALDHVRDYFHLSPVDPTDMSATTPLLFFTRWITHFCAPTFVFLSGVSAYLSGQRKSKAEASLFLIKRGAWLVLLELTLITLGWTFDPLYHLFILQVIWAIGWSMIILGAVLAISPKLVPVLGLLLVLGHNITDYTQPAGNAWTILMTSPPSFIGFAKDRGAFDLYAILPWTGIMMLGYSIGTWFSQAYTPERRRKTLLIAGFAVTGVFIILRLINHYGDRAPWSVQPRGGVITFLSFLNVTKYPPSLMYTCMTLGPALLLLAVIEKAKGAFSNILQVYGRVPFFYYILHLYLIHLCCAILFFATGHTFKDAVDPVGVPFLFHRHDVGFGLAGVYAVWLFVVTLLYFPCKWYDAYKRVHHQWWLSYV